MKLNSRLLFCENAEEEETGVYISYVRISDDEKALLYA
jgi:hypothetical protein